MNRVDYKNIIYKIVQIISVCLFTWILLVLCIGNFVDFACKKNFLINNIGLIVIDSSILYLIKKGNLVCNEKNEKKINLGLKLFTVFFFFVQIIICYNIFFETGWDAGGFVIPAAKTLMAKGDLSDLNELYFRYYPNNLFIVNVFFIILKINKILRIFTGEYELMAIVVCNCMISSITCWLIYKIGKSLLPIQYAVVGYVTSIILIGLSPWMLICYSDSLALFIPVLILYIYLKKKWKSYIRRVFIVALGYVGCCIKPQVVIIVIAIILVEGIKQLRKPTKNELCKLCVAVLMIGVLIGGLSGGLRRLYQYEGFVVNSEQSLGLAHYFMMGLNDQTNGVYYGEDAIFSKKISTSKERTEKNLKIAQERLKEKGGWGYLKFLSKKMLINYDDGTFAWGAEGGFYSKKVENAKLKAAPLLKDIYYNDGKYFPIYATIAQATWILVLIGCWCVSIKAVLNKKVNIECLVMLTTIIGITIFELLFEARARYLYIYVPIYILIFINYLDPIKKKGIYDN